MKRIDNLLQEHNVRCCRMYKEDIQQVIELMTRDGQPPQLTCEGYEFAGADELFAFLGEKGKPEIGIQRQNLMASLSASSYPDQVTMRVYDKSDEGVALVRRIGEVLNRCEGRKPIWARGWFAGIGALLFLIGTNSPASPAHTESRTLLLIGLSIIGFVMFALPLVRLYTNPSKFYGISRNSRKSFLQRKGDDLLVALIAGVVGAALGVAGTLFTQAYTAHETKGFAVQSNTGPSATSPTSH